MARESNEKDKSDRSSPFWEYFDDDDPENSRATCKLCSLSLSYEFISNLKKHLVKVHKITFSQREQGCSEDETNCEDNNDNSDFEWKESATEDESPQNRRNRSPIWKHFKVLDAEKRLAVCHLCQETFSYLSTTTNLMRHLQRMHDVYMKPEDTDMESSQKRTKISNWRGIWAYYELIDGINMIATCNICQKELSCKQNSNLVRHLKVKHVSGFDFELETDLGGDDDETEAHRRPIDNHVNRSVVWDYFKCIDPNKKVAKCMTCNKRLSYMTTVTNLKRHVWRKHPHIPIKKTENEEKRIILSKDGQLYELDLDAKAEILDDDDDQQEKDILEMNTVYLDEFSGDTKPPPKKRKIISDTNRTVKNHRDSFSEMLHKNAEMFHKNESYEKPQPVKKEDSLDLFGKYIISLLRQLPKTLSSKLQMDFVKQAIDAQITYETESTVTTVPNNGYSITITQDESVPGTVTVSSQS